MEPVSNKLSSNCNILEYVHQNVFDVMDNYLQSGMWWRIEGVIKDVLIERTE